MLTLSIEVTGDVSYGGISASKQHAHYRGEVNYNPEDDQHFPTLNVWQTLKFSLLNKTRKREQGEINIIVGALVRMFGISHTTRTLVGNEFVRGISGGERKRVSIAETLATKSTVVCWDNSTRGLDASTALDYANSLRIMTDVSDRTTLVTLYQAGEGIYELMGMYFGILISFPLILLDHWVIIRKVYQIFGIVGVKLLADYGLRGLPHISSSLIAK